MKKAIRVISGLASILMMVIIFMFSNQVGVESQHTSDTALKIFQNVPLLNWVFTIIPIRKVAHMFVFFMLGLNTTLFMSTFDKIILGPFIAVLYAIFDETHQLFVSSRSGSPIDVLIDSTGIIISFFLVYFGTKILGKDK